MDDLHLVEEDDYYAVLGLGREASTDEINNAYRKMSRLFHPDKHATNEKATQEAQLIFTKIKKAHEVLSDPHTKVIYDTVGVKGLETDGWQVVSRDKTPAEILQEYENLKQANEQRKLEQKTNPHVGLTVEVDATDVFDKYKVIPEYGSWLPNIEVSSISVGTSVDCPLTTKDTVCLAANIASENGNGSGNLIGTYRRVISSKCWAEVFASVGTSPSVGMKGFRRLWANAYGTMSLSVLETGRGPGVACTTMVVQQLSRSVSGKLVLVIEPKRSFFQTVAMYSSDPWDGAFVIQLGTRSSFISMRFSYLSPEHDFSLRGSAKLGTMVTGIECGCSKKITKFSRLSASVSVYMPSGVRITLKLMRGNHAFVVPIHLSEEIMLEPIFYGTIVPALTYAVVKVFFVNPFLRSKTEKDLQRKKDANASRIAEKKREAEATMELMKESIERSYRVETEKGGLVIKKALYGKLEREDEVIHVTKQVQGLVKDSRILVPATTQLSQLPGFYDPSIGEEKALAITYTFRNQLHMCQYKQEEKILIPSREHVVDEASGS